MEIPETDQWKLQGNCKLCRRKSYCNKGCKAASNSLSTALFNKIMSRADENTGGLMTSVLNEVNRYK